MEGNSWSDYNGTGSYMIAGLAGASDPYPASDLYTSIPSETGFISLLFRIGLFVFVCGLVLVVFLVNSRNKSV